MLLVPPHYPHPAAEWVGTPNEHSALALNEVVQHLEILTPRPYAPRVIGLNDRWRAYSRIPREHLRRGLRVHRPAILHLHLHTLFGPYALLARSLGVSRVYVTDHNSRAEGAVDRRLSLPKRVAFRYLMASLTGVVCVSRYVQRSLLALGLLPHDRTTVIYVRNDRYESVPGYDSWWDVPPAEVSESVSVQEARRAWEAKRAEERTYL